MNRLVFLTGTSVTAILAVLLYLGHGMAERHVRYIMGGVDAPVNCASCHVYMKKEGFIKNLLEKDYLSPHDLAVSPDGSRLYVVAEDMDMLLEVSVEDGTVLNRMTLGDHPHSIVLSPDGRTAYVTNNWSDNISVIDLESWSVTGELPTGSGPEELAFSADGRYLYTANTFSNDISIIDLAEGTEVKRLPAGHQPYAVGLTPDGSRIMVTNRLTKDTGFRESPITEVTVVNTATLRVDDRKLIRDAHLVESIDFTPEGDLALVTVVRPKQLLPTTQVNRGWMLTYGIGIIELEGEGRIFQLLTDEVNAFYADPYDILISPDGKRAYVSYMAADLISVIDMDAVRAIMARATEDSLNIFANHLGLSTEFVIKRIPTGSNPKRMALSPDGKRLYVAEHLSDHVGVIDTETLEPLEPIDLGGPKDVTVVRLGDQMFHRARALQGQFSCRTCHPDGDQDALSWDFGADGLGQVIVNTMTLREVGQTSPFKWQGSNVSLYMQDGIRFAKHLTRVESWPPKELYATVAYMYSIPAPPNPELTPAQQRGKYLFERSVTMTGEEIPESNRCITCHSGPYYTNQQKFDVGTRRSTDPEWMLFDTPQLVNIYATPPYLHDGSAATLEEIWTVNSVHDEHGMISDLTKTELNDLIEYLRTLGLPNENK